MDNAEHTRAMRPNHAMAATRRYFLASASSLMLAACGTRPGVSPPSKLTESVVGLTVEERREMYTEYRRLDPRSPRRFDIRNELGEDLMSAIERGYRMHQDENGWTRHVIGVADRVPGTAMGLIGPFIHPPLPAGFLSALGPDGIGLPKALLGEAYYKEADWGRIQLTIEKARLAQRREIHRRLALPDTSYRYPWLEADLWDFWDAANPSKALARAEEDGARRRGGVPEGDGPRADPALPAGNGSGTPRGPGNGVSPNGKALIKLG